MPLTKQYLRYVNQSSFGVVGSRKSAAILLETRSRQLRVVAAALEDVIIWNPRRGEKVAILRGEKHEVSALALGQDESLLAAGYEDGSVKLWNIQSHHCQITFSGHKSAITCLQFDQSGTRLVSGSKDTDVILWDIVNEAGLYRLRGHKGNITDCRFMTSQNVLVTSSKDTLVKLWDLDTQHCFQTLVGHRSEVWSIELVAMETRLVTGSSDNELRVFEVKARSDETQHTGQKRRVANDEEDHKSPVTCSLVGSLKREGRERVVQIKSDPSGGHLGCLTADSTLVVYRILPEAELDKVVRKRTRKAQKRSRKTGGEVVEEVKHTVADELPIVYSSTYRSKVRAFDFLAKVNGDLQLLLGLQNNSLEVRSLTTSTHPVTSDTVFTIAAPGHRTDVRTVGFSSDDTCLVSGSSKMIKIWNRSTQQCVRTMQSGYALCSAFVPGDRHVLIGCKSGDLQLFDIASGSMLEGVRAHSGALWSVGVAPDKRGFVTGGADHNVKFWEFELVSDEVVKSRKRLSLSHVRTLKMSEDVLVVKYTPDQRLLAVALLDCTVKVFFSDTLKFFLSLYGHKLPVLSMDISSDSTLLVTSSADKNIKIWGLDFGDCHKSIFAHDDSIVSVEFVPKTHLVFSGSKDKTIKCWDADTFDHIMTLEGHQGEVWCLSVSNDGDTVVSGSHDFSLRLWVRTQEPLILSEEREMEREAQFEGAVAEGGEPVIPGEGNTEVVMAGRKTFETVKAAERIMEALEVYREERAKMEEYQEDCKEAGKKLPCPQPHPMLIATGNPKPERYVLDVVKKIRSSELEESLLVMPFSEVTELLKLLDLWIQSDWEVELSCRCLFFLLRVHHHQIVSNQQLLPVIDSLRLHTLSQVDSLRDLYGFNLAGLQYMQRELVAMGTHVFGDVSEQLNQIRKKRRITVHTT